MTLALRPSFGSLYITLNGAEFETKSGTPALKSGLISAQVCKGPIWDNEVFINNQLVGTSMQARAASNRLASDANDTYQFKTDGEHFLSDLVINDSLPSSANPLFKALLDSHQLTATQFLQALTPTLKNLLNATVFKSEKHPTPVSDKASITINRIF